MNERPANERAGTWRLDGVGEDARAAAMRAARAAGIPLGQWLSAEVRKYISSDSRQSENFQELPKHRPRPDDAPEAGPANETNAAAHPVPDVDRMGRNVPAPAELLEQCLQTLGDLDRRLDAVDHEQNRQLTPLAAAFDRLIARIDALSAQENNPRNKQ